MDDGGPAFPILNGGAVCNGMSLRDWFAGQALVGLLVDNQLPHAPGCAQLAYELADAMLKERERRNGDG